MTIKDNRPDFTTGEFFIGLGVAIPLLLVIWAVLVAVWVL